jgi:hypothetical protein
MRYTDKDIAAFRTQIRNDALRKELHNRRGYST